METVTFKFCDKAKCVIIVKAYFLIIQPELLSTGQKNSQCQGHLYKGHPLFLLTFTPIDLKEMMMAIYPSYRRLKG